MADYLPSHGNDEEISLVLKEAKLEVKNFTEYSFNSDFLTPADGWSFTIGAGELSDELQAALVPGAEVELRLNGAVHGTGYIDSIECSASRGSGREWRIEGRDKLAQAVDANADPTVAFKEGQTLSDAVKQLFALYGWSKDEHFVIDNTANTDAKTSKYRHKSKRSDARGFSRRALREYKLHQTRPYPREGVYEFASRMSQRFGLWIWMTADGEKLVLSDPDFTSEPMQKLFRSAVGDVTNVLEGSVKRDIASQPTHIVADSYSRGGEFGRGRVKVIMANNAVKCAVEPDFSKYIAAGARIIKGPEFPADTVMKAARPRVLYLHDDESQDQDQLEAFVRREMAQYQRKSLEVTYTVEGHGQTTPNGWVPWVLDSTVEVHDDVADLNETLYLLGRTFNKSRSGGTTTQLHLIRLNTLVFSDVSKGSK